MKNIINLDSLQLAADLQEYPVNFRDTTPYKMNVFGIRNYSDKYGVDETFNIFNDTLGVSFYDAYENYHLFLWRGTTDPGEFYMKHPLNTGGTAQLVKGHYDSYKIDYHRGKYLALCQRRDVVTVKRFKTIEDWKNGIGLLDIGMFGINVHKSLDEIETVDKGSAGCLVFYDNEDFDIFMSLCFKHKERHGNKFALTLFEYNDFLES